MPFEPALLRLYTQVSEHEPLPWSWVDDQLRAAPTFWVVAAPAPGDPAGPPHPRPVWGVWTGEEVYVSVGSPPLRRAFAAGGAVTVHLDSGTDVVVVEGTVRPSVTPDDAARAVAAYDAKYDYSYDVETYGPLACVDPATILAWRTAGWAGRDSFQSVGKWTPVSG